MKQKNRQEYLMELMDREGLSLSEMMGYAQQHKEDLARAKNIFSMKTEEDVRRVFALPALLLPQLASKLNSYVKETYPKEVTVTESDKRYVLTALVQDSLFFTQAWNWCTYVAYSEQKQAQQAVKVFRFDFQPEVGLKAYKAATVGGFQRFGTPTTLDNIGLLEQRVETKHKRIQFKLTPDSTLQGLKFSLQIEFKTPTADTIYVAELNQDNLLSKPIQIDNIDQGIQLISVEVHKE